MKRGRLAELGSASAWLAFPMVPAILGITYHGTLNLAWGRSSGPDPREWDWPSWIILMGPLLGYGFLAGATSGLPDDPDGRGVRRLIARRSVWVAVGPWIGFLGWSAVVGAAWLAVAAASLVHPPSRDWAGPEIPASWWEAWPGWLLARALAIAAVGSLALGWLFVARAALRRAGRLGRFRQSLGRGVVAALTFVGSLIGSFWAATEAWRGYFFDPRVIPALVAATSMTLMAGCAATETYGEVRRRELFRAILMAWLLGLALAWRWWSRPRSNPPGPP